MTLSDQRDPDMTAVHQQTFWQTLFRGALCGWLTAQLLITILFAVDLLTSEQRHRSIVRSSPQCPWHAINTKTLTVQSALSGEFLLSALVVAGFVIPVHGL